MNKETEDKHIANTYQKRQIEIVSGNGTIVRDAQGREYLDLVAGNGVALLGHAHPVIIKAVSEQAKKIITCPGIFYNDARAEFAETLSKIMPSGPSGSSLECFFFSNSGTESVECAIKLARKKTGRTQIISMTNGFHGRTLGALSATWKPKYRQAFEPLVPGFSHAEHNNIESLREKLSQDTAAVILEPVQGEAGVILPSQEYLKQARELCTERGALMIVDEIQTFARTGNFFASKTFGIQPDIICLAKGIAGGIPIGITAATQETFAAMQPGDHGSTFGGNPLACAAGTATLQTLRKEKLVEHGAKTCEQLKNRLADALSQNKTIREVRGIGAMIAVESRLDISNTVRECLQNRVLIQTSGRTTIRLLPPLVITTEQAETAAETITKTFK